MLKGKGLKEMKFLLYKVLNKSLQISGNSDSALIEGVGCVSQDCLNKLWVSALEQHRSIITRENEHFLFLSVQKVSENHIMALSAQITQLFEL